ncbi:MAG TPA: MaoC family dehydratase, partial [Candidatus Binataceae bacterium]
NEAARQAGFKAPIAAGEQVFALIAQLMVDRFGMRFLRGGGIEAAFVKPVLFGDTLAAFATVEHVNPENITFQIRVENQNREKVLMGTARIRRAD